MKNILVIFQATREETEGCALALGLGAVQGGANIRLRHLDPSPDFKLGHAGYGTLKTDDLRWAEGIAVLTETDQPKSLEALAQGLIEIANEEATTRKRSFIWNKNPTAESVCVVERFFSDAGVKQLSHEGAAQVAVLDAMTRIGHDFANEAL